MGTGWCGVLKWCGQFKNTGFDSVEDDPTLALFDLLIIHLDTDVADKAYADCGNAIAAAASTLPLLPCSCPCPPVGATVFKLKTVLLGWLGFSTQDSKTLFCIPSKSSESWLAAALLPDDHNLLQNLECNLKLADEFDQLPKEQRLKKNKRVYQSKAQAVTQQWCKVCKLCSQAQAFHDAADWMYTEYCLRS